MSVRSIPALWIGGLLSLLLPLRASALPSRTLTVKFEMQDGSKVSDITTVVVRVTSSDDTDIQKVEFSVDGKLRSTDASIPYGFDWDTLGETEGKHTLSATAYDAKGATQSNSITVEVDNELSKGADYHANAALAALKSGDTDKARKDARRALKIAPDNLTAARALAALYRQDRDSAKAIAVLEKANIPDNDIDTRADLVSLHMLNGSTNEHREGFFQDANAAMEIYHKLALNRVAAVTGDDAAADIRRGDALFGAHDWN